MKQSEEALSRLTELLIDITSSSRNLLLILRKCQFVCEILGLNEDKLWFFNEINGYSKNSTPYYRHIKGYITWDYEGNIVEQFLKSFENNQEIKKLKELKEPVDLNVFIGINWIVSAANNGYLEKTSEVKVISPYSGNIQYPFRKTCHYPNYEFNNILQKIEEISFNWISKTYVNLKYSSQIKTLWERYQVIVEGVLNKINLSNHLKIINDAIIDENPEKWRVAVLGTRNLLHDLAEYLWQDPRPTYSRLQGSGISGELEVTSDKYVNRLCAYLHQKEIIGKQGKFLRGELDKLGNSISNLNSVEGNAHDTISRELFETVVLFSYFLIGELAIKTDFEPIINYDNFSSN
jgi:hypothetical protein